MFAQNGIPVAKSIKTPSINADDGVDPLHAMPSFRQELRVSSKMISIAKRRKGRVRSTSRINMFRRSPVGRGSVTSRSHMAS